MRNPFLCLMITSAKQRDQCIAQHLLYSAWWNKNPRLCELFPEWWDVFAYACNMAFQARAFPSNNAESPRAIPSILDRNVLLMAAGGGMFVDRAIDKNVSVGGYSWTGKFADLDNDEWQDLYLVNGTPGSLNRTSKIFYRNQGGARFVDETERQGLVDYWSTGAFTFIDIDNDGDLDIISAPFDGPIRVNLNNGTTGHAIVFELRDHVGNSSGIGSKIIIHYGPGNARHQVRELKMSGGYLSFDAPLAHFGLGDFDTVRRVEVIWSTGERSIVRSDFRAGARYRITRQR